MATLTGMDRSERAITQAIKRALSGPVKKFIMNDLNQRLDSQVQPDGKAFPKKAESAPIVLMVTILRSSSSARVKAGDFKRKLMSTGERFNS